MKSKNKSKNKKIFVIQTLVLVSILLIQIAIPMFTQAGNNLTKIESIEAASNATGIAITVTSKASPNNSKITKVQVFKTATKLSEDNAEDDELAMAIFNNVDDFNYYDGQTDNIATPDYTANVQYETEEITGYYYYILATNEAAETYMSRKAFLSAGGDITAPTLVANNVDENTIEITSTDAVGVTEIRIGTVTKANNSIDFEEGTAGTDFTVIPITAGTNVGITLGTATGADFSITNTAFYEICVLDAAGNMKTTYVSLADLINLGVGNDAEESQLNITASGNLFSVASVKYKKVNTENENVDWSSEEELYSATAVQNGEFVKNLLNVPAGLYIIRAEDSFGNSMEYVKALGKPVVNILLDDAENPTKYIIKAKSPSGAAIQKIYFVGSTTENILSGPEIELPANELVFTNNNSWSVAEVPYNENYVGVSVYVKDVNGKAKARAMAITNMEEEDSTAPTIEITQPEPANVKQGSIVVFPITLSESVTRTGMDKSEIQLLTNTTDGEINGIVKGIMGSGKNWTITVEVGQIIGYSFLYIPEGFFEDSQGNKSLEEKGGLFDRITVETDNSFDLIITAPSDTEISNGETLDLTITTEDELVLDLQENLNWGLLCGAANVGASYEIEQADTEGKVWTLSITAGTGNGNLIIEIPEGLFKANNGTIESAVTTNSDVVINNGGTVQDTIPPTLEVSLTLATDKSYVTISATATDALSNVVSMKIAEGEKTKEYFENNGIVLLNNGLTRSNTKEYKATENGKYTIYAKDAVGNEIVLVKPVAGIVIAGINNNNENNIADENNISVANNTVDDNNVVGKNNTVKDNTTISDNTQSNKVISQLGQSNFIVYEIILFAVISVISYIKYVKVW